MRTFFLTLALVAGSAAFAQTAPATPTTPAVPAQSAPATATPAAATPAPADPATPVATVGGNTITLGQFDAYFRQLAGRSVNAQGVPLTDDLLVNFNQYRPQLLQQFARQQAILQLARTAGFKADAAEIDKNFADAKSDFATDAEFKDALNASGYADADTFRATLEDGAVYNAYLNSIKAKFKFGDALVASYYQLNKSSFAQDAQACAKHILVATQPEAQDIVKKLAGGAAFADLAKASSKDPGSAGQGGDLGCLGMGETVPAFDKAAFTGPLNTPQVVQTEFGWHVLVVSSRTPAGVQPLADVSAKIRDQLAGEAAQKYVDAQVAKLKIVTMPEVVTVAPAPTNAAPADAAPAGK
ncbi:peptidylprolyl isomerase [Deinococcus aquiradiocola]|uniref:peptidylprolyl isomerase n=1 Tax=Deinococcus aquiradiocola TaxID=393059 RepID=UPI0016629AA4|nr:peptidylprolyl isomerase [Deinococcus aquiradiocola]